MKKSSRFFRKLNCMTCCDGPLNRLALCISRGLCEANDALPSRKGCCPNDRCDNCKGKSKGRR